MVDEKESKPNGLAIAAMVLGICGFAILPIVFGAIQLSKIKKGEASGKGMAIAGLVIGIVRLVLAALVTIMVFVSLPSLQRSSRDTIRRNDYAIIASAITNYQSNNAGKLPSASSSDAFVNNYLTGLYDPETFSPYSVTIRENSGISYESVSIKKGEVIIETGVGYDCSGGRVQSERAYRLIGYLESGSYCSDN